MQREIKFRAWFDNKEQTMNVIKKGMYEVRAISFDKDRKPRSLCILERLGDEGSQRYHEIIGNVTQEREFWLMQYTGLKDSTGTEIYEGDIFLLKQKADRIEIIYSVIFENGAYYAKFEKSDNDEQVLKYHGLFAHREQMPNFPFYLEQKIEVIGNVFENPELLNNK